MQRVAPMRDMIIVSWMLVSFAALVTAHLMLLGGLALHRPRWRAMIALVVPPLAPYWGARTGMRARAAAWVASAVAYAIARVLGR